LGPPSGEFPYLLASGLLLEQLAQGQLQQFRDFGLLQGEGWPLVAPSDDWLDLITGVRNPEGGEAAEDVEVSRIYADLLSGFPEGGLLGCFIDLESAARQADLPWMMAEVGPAQGEGQGEAPLAGVDENEYGGLLPGAIL
jgi:hypothetical protein